MIIREKCGFEVSNPLDSVLNNKPIMESLLSDLKISEVRAIYPLIRAINSGRLTRNSTFYPAESLIGKTKLDDPTGYASFAKPYGKPILREHQAQNVPGLMGPIETADVPMGRVVYSGFRRYQEKKDGPRNLPSKKYIPGTVEGDGSMFVVPAITDPEAITRVLGGAYHTVSIGSRVDNVTESISNQNIAELRRQGKELPPYERGQLYEGKLSYWKMGEVRGLEVSFVNVPSDEYAKVVDPDIGADGIRLLVAEKKPNSKEFCFFDAKTAEKVDLGHDEGVWDESFFVDSAKVGHNLWWLNVPKENAPEDLITESKEKSMTINDILEKNLDEMINLYPEHEEEALKEALLNKFVYEGDLDTAKLVDGEGADLIENIELFQKVSEFATDVVTDWNETACKFAVSLYLANEGTLKIATPLIDENAKVTVGELYGIEGDDASLETSLTHKEWKELPEDCFVGPNRTIPVTNFESAVYAAKLFNETIHDIHNQIWKEYGIVFYTSEFEGKKTWGIEVNPIFVKVDEGDTQMARVACLTQFSEVAPLLENVNTICETYNLGETEKDQVIKFLEQISEETFKSIEGAPLFAYTEQSTKPVVLGTAFLLDYFVKNETTDSRENLVTLVGLIRKMKISKEALNEAYEAYKPFGTSVLKKFLENTPEKSIVIETAPKDEIKSVETIPDPAAATEKTDDGKTTNESKNLPWLVLSTRPKRSGKTPVIKEKR